MPSGLAPRSPGVVRVRQDHRPARGVDLGRHRAGLRVGGAHLPGQFLRRLVVRADHELAPQLARPLDVDDDPARDVTRQQPGAPLQRDRLAERAVVEQQPGHRGDHVHPARHGLDRAGRALRAGHAGVARSVSWPPRSRGSVGPGPPGRSRPP